MSGGGTDWSVFAKVSDKEALIKAFLPVSHMVVPIKVGFFFFFQSVTQGSIDLSVFVRMSDVLGLIIVFLSECQTWWYWLKCFCQSVRGGSVD